MSAKEIYLVVKSTYRENKFVFRNVVCVNSSLDIAFRNLIVQVKGMSLSECITVDALSSKDAILVSGYRDAVSCDSYADNIYEIYKMTMNELGSDIVHFTDEQIKNIKDVVYGC